MSGVHSAPDRSVRWAPLGVSWGAVLGAGPIDLEARDGIPRLEGGGSTL
jgi:hypothetical protein